MTILATTTASSSGKQLNGHASEIRPRPPFNPLPTPSEGNGHLKAARIESDNTSSISSGRSTPVPEDAPPSAHSIQHARREKRRRMFPTVAYESRVSHFDPQSQYHDFRGFFALFWIGIFIMVLNTALRNYRDTGKVLRTSIFSLFYAAPAELAFADLAMACSTVICLPLQKMFARNFIHSYSFYCGHLSDCHKQLKSLDSNNTTVESEADAELREKLAFELTCPAGKVTYPQNLTLPNFLDYLLCPTLCYEMSYPRVDHIRWVKVAEKAAAVFGCVFVLTVTSEEFILPVMTEAALRLESVQSWAEIGLVLLESISLLLFPYMITFLLVFLVIFEYVLGAFAEITCFADRHFYADWWNSTNWLEFSREWNIPVHRFLQRHVYGASRRHMSRSVATLVTFLISAAAHELVLFCITKKLRGYGFVCQMLQLPIIAVQRTKFMQSWHTLNNIMFWCSMIWGLAMISALYVLI
ncbi:uncharacterized protein H6S33_003163 [Morchella sextelata]|uniref:uncharacterized protein n=1 Tax=Morchella sextelata TaxID=1174677 RepID=UPI001D03D5B0|nr:uncharacterized protein H6S33_003163 [Morchella sextelata]KAH0607175.1 hypothetical protein H6S33_003163 [Morchella sextelata]